MKLKHVASIVAGVMLTALLPSAASAADFKLLHSWDKSTDPSTAYVLDYFVPKLQEAIPGTKIVTFGPGTVPPFEQMEPARSGVFQFLFTHTAYHFGTTRGAFGNDAIEGTAAEKRAAGIWDEIDRQYQKYNLKLIAMMPIKDGFHIQVSKPLTNGTLEGMRIRGTQVYHGLIKHLGGAPVVIPIGEVYSALERGVVQGAASPLTGSVALNWNSVAKHLVRPRIGTPSTYLFMNLGSFNVLPDDQKALVLKVGRNMEETSDPHFAALTEKEEKALLASGSSVQQVAPDKAAEIKQVWADSLFDLAAGTSAADSNRLRELARKAKLTP